MTWMVFVVLFSVQGMAEPAHVHGEGQINMAFEGQEGQIELDVPTDSVLGFESEAHSEKEKSKEKEILELFKNNLSQVIQLDNQWGCQIHPEKVNFVRHGIHRDLEASYKVRCSRAIKSGHIDFNIQKIFPSWKKVKVQILTPSTQKSQTITKNGESLEIK